MEDLANVIRAGTGSGLDFVILEELRKRTSIMPVDVLKFAMSEMLCNSLDTDATIIEVFSKLFSTYTELSVRDNGSKPLSLKDIKLILDFSNKASSKRGFLRVSRGYLGNALKCIFGYSYALAIEKGIDPPSIIIESGSKRYTIDLKPNRIKETIGHKIAKSEEIESPLTMFTVRIPHVAEYVDTEALEDIIAATSMVNPDREIHYDIFGDGEKVVLGTMIENTQAPKRHTSTLWYDLKQFVALFNDFLRTEPETPLKGFIGLFRTLSRKKPIRDVLHSLAESLSLDSTAKNNMQFVPHTPIHNLGTKDITALYHSMRKHTKQIKKRSIPSVGKAKFEDLSVRRGWKRTRYAKVAGFITRQGPDAVSFPCLVELAVFDRDDDGEGLKAFQCVNFMASQDDVFSSIFSIPRRLGQVNIADDMPVTIVTHLVCPVLEWLSHGKSGLGRSSSISAAMQKVFDKILPIPKTPRVYRPPPPPKLLKWWPRGKLGNPNYEYRLEQCANEVLLLEGLRSDPVKYGSRDWCYLLEGIGKIDKGEFTVVQGGLANCRKADFLPIDFMALDKDESRHFGNIHGASDPKIELTRVKDDVVRTIDDIPFMTTDYWVGEQFYLMMCVEKSSLRRLFEPVCNEYHVPIVSSKGWSPINLLSHIARLGQRAEKIGLKPILLVFYDHDKDGLKISDSFKDKLYEMVRGTGWSPHNLFVDRFGLNKEDIDKHGLMWIENLKSSRGKEAHAPEYVAKFGRRKCESNALFRNDETLAIGRQLCRNAIEKYYGEDALERFGKKEAAARERLSDIYESSVWKQFYDGMDKMMEDHFQSTKKDPPRRVVPSVQKEVEVFVDGKHCGRCPNCGAHINYTEKDYDRLGWSKCCGLLTRLRLKEKGGDP